jgi:microcystin-dependent protein
MRSLTPLVPPVLTTAQRNALPEVLRATGAIVLNSDTGRLEQNVGSSGTPSWLDVGRWQVGELVFWPYGIGQAPAGASRCDGATLVRADNPKLNAIAAADAYPHGNGDTSTTFNKPDYRGRMPMGFDNMGTAAAAASRVTASSVGGGNASSLGGTGGLQIHTLLTAEIPSHAHDVVLPAADVDSVTASTARRSTAQETTINVTSTSVGGGGSHNNMPPWAACHILVAIG